MADNTSSKTSRNPAILEIALAKTTHLFPWSHFLFAEGGSDEISLAFSTHNIVITGRGLDSLLSDIENQQVNSLAEPIRADKFATSSKEYQIAGITVKKCDD